MTSEERKAHQQCLAQILQQNPVSEQLMGLLKEQRMVLFETQKREAERKRKHLKTSDRKAYDRNYYLKLGRERYLQSERGKDASANRKRIEVLLLQNRKQAEERIARRKALTQARDLVEKLERKVHRADCDINVVEPVVVDYLAEELKREQAKQQQRTGLKALVAGVGR